MKREKKIKRGGVCEMYAFMCTYVGMIKCDYVKRM